MVRRLSASKMTVYFELYEERGRVTRTNFVEATYRSRDIAGKVA